MAAERKRPGSLSQERIVQFVHLAHELALTPIGGRVWKMTLPEMQFAARVYWEQQEKLAFLYAAMGKGLLKSPDESK